ncbi:MAG: ribulose-phosphate 3-epimerase [Clostridia bacterium]|nr:ribulose-phosphate 3-epimerase [Clostridia bacterium]
MILIYPSLFAADFSKLAEEISRIEFSADYLHLDVMDGVFVPNLSMGPNVIKDIRKRSDLIFDVHLMISDPFKYVDEFIAAGADIITFHLEAVSDPVPLISHIKASGKHVGIAISPDTPAEAVFPYLDSVDMILVMTVYPGFGGQKMIPEMTTKIADIRHEINKRGLEIDIEVDGGIGIGNVGLLTTAGANVIVAGSAVFKAEDASGVIEDIRDAAESAPYSEF